MSTWPDTVDEVLASDQVVGFAYVTPLRGVVLQRLPDRVRTDRILADGPYVVVQARGDAKTKSGVEYNNEYCFVYRVEDGRIREVVEYLDTELVTSALAS